MNRLSMNRDEFLALKRDEMFERLRAVDPDRLKGKSRARKEEYIHIYDDLRGTQLEVVAQLEEAIEEGIASGWKEGDPIVFEDLDGTDPKGAVLEATISTRGVDTGRLEATGHLPPQDVRVEKPKEPGDTLDQRLLEGVDYAALETRVVASMASATEALSSPKVMPIEVEVPAVVGRNDHKVAALDAKLMSEAHMLLSSKPYNRKTMRIWDARFRKLHRELNRAGYTFDAVARFLKQREEQAVKVASEESPA